MSKIFDKIMARVFSGRIDNFFVNPRSVMCHRCFFIQRDDNRICCGYCGYNLKYNDLCFRFVYRNYLGETKYLLAGLSDYERANGRAQGNEFYRESAAIPTKAWDELTIGRDKSCDVLTVEKIQFAIDELRKNNLPEYEAGKAQIGVDMAKEGSEKTIIHERRDQCDERRIWMNARSIERMCIAWVNAYNEYLSPFIASPGTIKGAKDHATKVVVSKFINPMRDDKTS